MGDVQLLSGLCITQCEVEVAGRARVHVSSLLAERRALVHLVYLSSTRRLSCTFVSCCFAVARVASKSHDGAPIDTARGACVCQMRILRPSRSCNYTWCGPACAPVIAGCGSACAPVRAAPGTPK